MGIHERNWVNCWIISARKFSELVNDNTRRILTKTKMPRKEWNERKKEKKKLDAAKECKTISSMFKSRYPSAVIYETCFNTSFITESLFSSAKKLFLENTCTGVSFLIKLQPYNLQVYQKKRLHHRCFPMNYAKFLRAPVLENISGRLLLLSDLNSAPLRCDTLKVSLISYRMVTILNMELCLCTSKICIKTLSKVMSQYFIWSLKEVCP